MASKLTIPILLFLLAVTIYVMAVLINSSIAAWNVSKLPVLQDDWRRTKLVTACNQIGGNWQENSDGFSCSWK